MSNETETEIGSIIAFFTTAAALGDDFFNSITTDDYFLKPIKEELFHKCKGAIKEAGIYKFDLTLTKIK